MKPRPRLTTVLSLCIVLSLLLTGVAQAALPDSIASPVQSQTGEQADNTISISGSPDSSANTTARASTPQKSLAPVQPASEPLASLLPAAEAAPMQASSGGECIPVVFIPGITGSPNLPPFNSPDQPMLQALESNGYKEGETLFRFSYNWLGSNASSASSLASYVNNIKDQIERRIGVRPEHVSIIAHSMGGFVTRLYLQGHSNEVDQVFTIGSPYAGSVEMIARGTRWSNIFNGPAELLPTWQAVFDPDGNPVSDNGGYGYNPWVQANIWPSPAPDIAFYGNQFDTSHTVTRTEYQVYDPYTGISTPSYFWERRDFIPGDETVDWQSAVTSVGSTRSVGGTHAGSVGFGSSRGVGGIVEAAAPQVVSLLTNSPNGGPENCYPYKLEITVDPESMEIPACMPVSYEVKVLNRDTEEPVDQLRDNERLEIRISGSALDDVTNESTTDPQYSGSTPSVKRPGGVTVEAKVTYLLVVPPSYVHTETMARDQASASVGLDDPPTRRDRCGRQETATFDDKTCSWKWPNGNKPCLPDDNRSVASPDLVQAAQEATVSSASIAVLANGFDQPLLDMLASLGIQADRIAPDFSPEMVGRYQVLVIPSGGLTGFAQSETMKQRLAQYAQNGGTIVAFAQEYGDQFTLLPGNALRAYGYDEDINCQANSTRIVTFAPMLLSQADELLSINVDGFFTDWSADTTVLLSRTANGMPAMLAYPFGDGWVLATTSYADMARFQGQGTADEAKLVRDLMTWALDPALQLDRYGPEDSVSIPLVATNNSMTPTTSIDLSIVDQQGTWVYASDAIPLDLAPGATGTLNTTIPMSAILAASDGQFGQWQVGVGLIDAEGVAVQSQ
ncbi:MAG: alpha/beta hydrolase, partial [Anaerolineae bacterium]|nr:alpha/beta hydrolase [Anaerolineae bacterium]